MSYVYRYTDLSDNVIKYVGIVCREGEDALSRRIEEHSYNDSWCFNKTWKIEYIEVPTKNDANSLESHFIAKWETHKWFNIKKKHDGLLSFIKDDFEWIVEKESLFVKEKEIRKSQDDMSLLFLRLNDKVAERLAEVTHALEVIQSFIEAEDYTVYPKAILLSDEKELKELEERLVKHQQMCYPSMLL